MPEILCVVDENDNFLRGEDRKLVHSSDMWHRGVHIFLYNSRGELLLQLRSPKKDKFPSTWDCSVSGHVEMGQSYKETAERELEEELGIKAPLKSLLHFRMCYGPGDNMVCKIFECHYDGELELSDETAETKLFREDELKKLLSEKPEMFAPWLAEHLRWKFGMPNKLIIFGNSANA